MSLLDCLKKNKFNQKDIDRLSARANELMLQLPPGTNRDTAERMAGREMLDEAIAERDTILELVSEASGIPVAELMPAAPEPVKEQVKEPAPPTPAAAAPVKGLTPVLKREAAPAATADKNIGREWDSTYGKQRIVNLVKHPTGDLYQVETVGKGEIRQYRPDQIDDVAKRDAHKLTPEYAAEQAEVAETNRLRAERDARAAATRAAVDATIAEFTAAKKMSVINAEKARLALTKNVAYKGSPISREALIEKLVAEGRTIGEHDGKRTLATADGSFMDESALTKTGMDYAEHLIAQREAAPDASDVSPTSTPTITAQPDGRIAVTGLPADKVRSVRDLLGIKGAIIGANGNAIFPKGTNIKALRESLGVTEPVKPSPASKFVRIGEGLNDAERELRSLARDNEQPGDVLLGNGKYASFDEVVRLTREGIESGAFKPAPAQLHFNLDLAMRDVDRVLAAATAPAAERPLSVGLKAKGGALNTEPVTVRDGVVYIGDDPATNLEGENITVPADASNAVIKQALETGGALTTAQRLYGGESAVKSKGIAATNPHDNSTLRAALIAAHPEMKPLLDNGTAQIVTAEQAGRVLGEPVTIRDKAFFNPEDSTTYFIAEHIDQATPLRGLIKHEVAVHAYQLGRTSAEFKDILRQVDAMKGAEVEAARARVPSDTPVEYRAEEVLAYLVQNNPTLGIVKRFIAWFRNAIRAIGWKAPLSVNDLAYMADRAMTGGTVVSRGGDAMRSVIRADGYNIIRDPGRQQAANLIARSEAGDLRGIRDPKDGSLYVWDAYKATHQDAAEVLGIDYKKAERLIFSAKELADLPPGVFSDEPGYRVTRTALPKPTVGEAKMTHEEFQKAFFSRGEPFDFSMPEDANVIRDTKIGDTTISLDVNANTGTVKIASVRTPQAKRNAGSARAAMQSLIAQADAEGVTLKLDASPLDARTKTPRLIAFYKSLGFLPTGKTMNAVGDIEMVRSPVKTSAPSRAFFSRNEGYGAPMPSERQSAFQKLSTVGEFLGTLWNNDKSLSPWMKSVGTQYHTAATLAKQGKHEFKRVFDKGQDFLDDVSAFSLKAENLAPTLFPRFKKVGDIFKRGLGASKADTQAIARPLYDGTLANKVWKDAELISKFGLNQTQIKLYREALSAVNQSVFDLAKAIIVKHAKLNDILVDREMPLPDLSAHVQKALNMSKAPETAERIDRAVADVKAIESKAIGLRAHGYFPLMRFGEHTVTMRDANNEVTAFSMFDSQLAANRAAEALALENPNQTVEKGVLSKKSWKLYGGLNLDALELFAEHTDKETLEPYQEYLRTAVSGNSAMKRMLQRKGTAGFSENVERTVAQMLTSNARHISALYNMGDMRKLVNAVPQGDIKDHAVDLFTYLSDANEEAAALRGFLFFNYIGGSVASAMVNLTQIPTMSAPFLTQYADAGRVTKALVGAARLKRGQATGDLKAAWTKAEEEGITAPQEIHQLTAQASNRLWAGSHGMQRFFKAWGGMFEMAESFNRETTFVAAFNIAKENGKSAVEAYSFAKDAVEQTQGIYNKGNRPTWGRGAIGATIFTFKQFSIMYLELLQRMPAKQRMLMLGVLMLAAGGEGEPFYDDITDMIDTVMQWLGYATNTKRAIRNGVKEALGEDVGSFVLQGVSSILPIDVQGRMSMSNLLPGTSYFKQSAVDKGRESLEVLGVVGSLIQNIGSAVENFAVGNTGGVIKSIAPVAVKNAYQGLEMLATGHGVDIKGRKTMDVSESEAAAKMIGFSPRPIAELGKAQRELMQDRNLQRVKEDEIVSMIVRGRLDNDPEAVAKGYSTLKKWNETNPELPIRIAPTQIQSRIRAAKMSSEQRFIKGTAPELRAAITRELRD